MRKEKLLLFISVNNILWSFFWSLKCYSYQNEWPALKGFKEIMNSRFHGEPCTPESLVVSGYEPDAHFVRETNVLEVEIVSFQDNKAWFIFEVELDGQTKISHIVIIDQNLCVTICGRCRRLRARRIRSFHSPLFQAENTSYKS